MASVSASMASYGATTASVNFTVSGVALGDQPWDLSVSGASGASYSGLPTGQNNGGTTGAFDVSGLTPSTSYTLTIKVLRDADGVTLATTTVSFTTTSGVPSWTDNTLAAIVYNVAYSDKVTATNSPTYSVSAGSLPTGISLNTSTGSVTGTATVNNQAYSFTLRAANAYGAVTQAFSGNTASGVSGGTVKVRTSGGTWATGTVKVWSGSAWTTGTVKVWSGSAWTTSL